MTGSEVPLIPVNISMHRIKFGISDMCLALHVVQILRLIFKRSNKQTLRDAGNSCIHLILIICHCQHLELNQLEAYRFLGCSDPTRTSPKTFGNINPKTCKMTELSSWTRHQFLGTLGDRMGFPNVSVAKNPPAGQET